MDKPDVRQSETTTNCFMVVLIIVLSAFAIEMTAWNGKKPPDPAAQVEVE